MAVLALTVFATISATLIIPPLLVEIASDLEISVAVAGQLATATFAGWAIMVVSGGPLSDSFGRRPVALVGLTVLSISVLASAFAPSLEILLVSRVLTGLAGGAIPPNIVGAVSDVISRQAGPGGKRPAGNSRAGFGHQRPNGRGAGRRGWLAVCLHRLRRDAGCGTAGELALVSERPPGASSQPGILLQVSITCVHAVFPRGRGGQSDTTHRFLGNDQLFRRLPDKYLQIEHRFCGPAVGNSRHGADGWKLFCCVRGKQEAPCGVRRCHHGSRGSLRFRVLHRKSRTLGVGSRGNGCNGLAERDVPGSGLGQHRVFGRIQGHGSGSYGRPVGPWAPGSPEHCWRLRVMWE